MAKSKTITGYKTPKLPLMWIKIDGEGEESLSGKMQYLASVLMTEEQKDALEAELAAFWKENRPAGAKKMKSNGISAEMRKTDETDEDGDPIKEPTGNYLLQFKTNATWPDGNRNKIKIFNAKGKPVELGETKIGNGSLGRIDGSYDVYAVKDKQGNVTNAGITFFLNGIQVIKLEEYEANSVEFDADDEEDGWTGDDDSFEGTSSVEEDSPKAGPRL